LTTLPTERLRFCFDRVRVLEVLIGSFLAVFLKRSHIRLVQAKGV